MNSKGREIVSRFEVIEPVGCVPKVVVDSENIPFCGNVIVVLNAPDTTIVVAPNGGNV